MENSGKGTPGRGKGLGTCMVTLISMMCSENTQGRRLSWPWSSGAQVAGNQQQPSTLIHSLLSPVLSALGSQSWFQLWLCLEGPADAWPPRELRKASERRQFELSPEGLLLLS